MLTIFEAIVLIKNLPKDQLKAAVRRTTGYILDKEGFFRQIHFLGLQKLPYRHGKNKTPYWEANYFYYEFNVTKSLTPIIGDEMMRDRDIIKHTFTSVQHSIDEKNDFENCTFEDEMKPVPFRPEVMKLVELAKRKQMYKDRRKLKLNMSSHFYPFQR